MFLDNINAKNLPVFPSSDPSLTSPHPLETDADSLLPCCQPEPFGLLDLSKLNNDNCSDSTECHCY